MYASIGTIRRVIIFDKISQNFEDQKPNSFDLYWSLVNYYITFCNELPGVHPVEIHVFFDTNFRRNENEMEGLIETKKIIPPQNFNAKLFFHCTNIIDCENAISTKWVQDIILPVKRDEWYFASSGYTSGINPESCISESICEKIQRVFPDIKLIPLEKRCDGGNMLLGRNQETDYLIIGWGETVQASDQELRKIYNKPSMRIYRVPDVLKEISMKLVHLDMYLTIIGAPVVPLYPVSELLFIGKAEGWCSKTVGVFNNALQTCADYLIGQQSPLFFHVVRIPLLIIRLQDEYFALSYNNCHVENIDDGEGRQSIHIYFPDYLMRLEERVKSYRRDDNPKLLALRHEIRYLLEEQERIPSFFQANDLDDAQTKYKKLSVEEQETFALEAVSDIKQLIRKTETKLTKICADLGFDGIHFIASDLFALSKTERGSLHCMSLVIDRE